MSPKTYHPNPIDTSIVELPREINELIERLAENTHEIWAKQRLDEGWKYGPERDDQKKEHPCLIPYAQLPDSEKEYDRKTAVESLKAIVFLGHRIVPLQNKDCQPTDSLVQNGTDQVPEGASAEDIECLGVREAIDLWQTLKSKSQILAMEVYKNLSNHLLGLGEPLMAYDVVNEGLKKQPGELRLRQLAGLALLRCGMADRAREELSRLRDEGYSDEETLGLLAHAHKDIAITSAVTVEKQRHRKAAYEIYYQAFKEKGGYYGGINAATMAILIGMKDKAYDLAEQVQSLCMEELSQKKAQGRDLYWLYATLGESDFIRQKWADAVKWYTMAAEQAGGRIGDLISTRNNARLLMGVVGNNENHTRIESCFDIPGVIVFSGHMIDREDTSRTRFPPGLEDKVKKALRERLLELNGRIGFASAACGSDILFLETILELGGEIHVVLPYEKEQFIRDSVGFAEEGDWVPRFHSILEKAKEVLVSSEYLTDKGTVLYEYANLLLLGLARIRANQLRTELTPLSVWDGQQGFGSGGTGSNVKYWRKKGLDIEIINIEELSGVSTKAEKNESLVMKHKKSAPKSESNEFNAQIKAILFADVVGFSSLNEIQLPLFINHFMGGVTKIMDAGDYSPLMKDSWGDAIYIIFSSAKEAGLFALSLSDYIEKVKWEEKGLPNDLNLRIALHAGPVFSYKDPISGKPGFIGNHVTRTARIEPVTPPGEVYVSRSFAAFAAAENVSEFVCNYVGLTPLAKSYGTLPMYHLRRMVNE